MLDSFSIHRAPFAVDTSRQILDSCSIAISCVFILDRSRYLSMHREIGVPINRVRAMFSSFLPYLSWQKMSPHLPYHHSLTPNLIPKRSSASRSFFFFGMMLSHSFILHFISFDQTFGVFENFWDFFKIIEGFAKFLEWVFVWMILNHHAFQHLHFNYIFMHYRCVLYMLNWCVLLGLD